jgi:hypothetical protein
MAWTSEPMQEAPLLPGSLAPIDGRLPLAYIYQPAGWWTAIRENPFTSFDRLRFPDHQRAIDFTKRHGGSYVAQPPPVRSFRMKSYGDNFR